MLHMAILQESSGIKDVDVNGSQSLKVALPGRIILFADVLFVVFLRTGLEVPTTWERSS